MTLPDDFPRLCTDHHPVIESAFRIQHVTADDARREAESKATSCKKCYALNGRSLR